MGIVSDYLREMIGRQIDEKRLIVWFDPERHYTAFAAGLALPNAEVACYDADSGFFALRRTIAPLLDGEEAPRLLVYVPLAQDETHDALIELTCVAVVLAPGLHPWQRNTRLGVIARAALKDLLGADQLSAIERQIEREQLSLADLDRMAERLGGQHAAGVVSIIFGAGDPETVALGLLDGRHDAAIVERQALPDITHLLGAAYGVELPPDEPPDATRARLARHILSTELLATLGSSLPARLATVKVASEPGARESCLHLARRWRQTRDLAESYVAAAARVEGELGLAGSALSLDQLADAETFVALEIAAQTAVEQALQLQPQPQLTSGLLQLVATRQRGYWAEQTPEVRARWALIGAAGKLLLLAEEIERVLNGATFSATDLFRQYTEGERPWRLLDTAQREMEQQAHRFDLAAQHTSLSELLATARRRYMAVGSTLAERFTHALAEADFQLPGVPRQREVYSTLVAPALRTGKTAYVLVDALRYEMACELAPALRAFAEVEISPALGTAPTITEIGMAALLPGAEGRVRVVPGGLGKLSLEIEGVALRDRKSRIEWLRDHAGSASDGKAAKVCDATLGDLLTLRREVQGKIKAADLIFITAQEIDEVGESDNITMARAVMDTLLSNLARGLRRLGDLGCQKIIVAADHGYLFGDEAGDDMKIAPPGGQQYDLHRRVWVGRGGTANPAYLRTPLAALGVGASEGEDAEEDGDLDLATPWGFGVFRAPGGASAYFHGGLSLPELVIPTLTLTPHTQSAPQASDEFEWALSLGSKKVSTRFCTVQVSGRFNGLFAAAPAPVRLEIRSGAEALSTAVAATYGFGEATRDIQMALDTVNGDGTRELQPNTVTLMLTRDDMANGPVTLHLLDATTGRELARLDGIEMAIAL